MFSSFILAVVHISTVFFCLPKYSIIYVFFYLFYYFCLFIYIYICKHIYLYIWNIHHVYTMIWSIHPFKAIWDFFFFSPLSYSEYCCYKQTCTYICLNNCLQFWGEGCIPKSGIVGSLDYLLLNFEDSASSWGQLVWSLLVLILCLVDFSNLFHPQFHLLSVSPSIHSFKFSLGITF